MHVDGAWGGNAVFSPKLRPMFLEGLETADSFNMNAHKGLGLPTICSILLTNNHPGAFESSMNSGSSYLFQNTATKEYDIGDKTMQCCRRPDSFKLWCYWKKYGNAGICAKVEK